MLWTTDISAHRALRKRYRKRKKDERFRTCLLCYFARVSLGQRYCRMQKKAVVQYQALNCDTFVSSTEVRVDGWWDLSEQLPRLDGVTGGVRGHSF